MSSRRGCSRRSSACVSSSLSCPDRSRLVARLKRRALRDNRLDDANEEVISPRLVTYEDESRPVLEHYGENRTVHLDATQSPVDVLAAITAVLARDRRNHEGEENFAPPA